MRGNGGKNEGRLSRGRRRSHVHASAMFVVKLSSDVTPVIYGGPEELAARVTTGGQTRRLQPCAHPPARPRDPPHFIILL